MALVGLLVAVLLAAGLAGLGAERRLSDRTADLKAARAALHDTRGVLASVRTELADRVKERDALRGELDSTKGSLSDARRSVEAQGQQLQTLKDCLTAIEDVGRALDRNDDAGARAALDRADRACSRAEAFL